MGFPLLDPVAQYLCRVSTSTASWKKEHFLSQARLHRFIEGNFFVVLNGFWKRCVPIFNVGAIIFVTPNEAGHHPAWFTLRKMREFRWPRLAQIKFMATPEVSSSPLEWAKMFNLVAQDEGPYIIGYALLLCGCSTLEIEGCQGLQCGQGDCVIETSDRLMRGQP